MLSRLKRKAGKRPKSESETKQATPANPMERKIWRETGLPEKEFINIYLPVFQQTQAHLENFARRQGRAAPEHQYLLDIYNAVRIRNAYILPKEGAPEEITKKAEAYTYALVCGMALDALRCVLSCLEGENSDEPSLLQPEDGTEGQTKASVEAKLRFSEKVLPEDGLRWLRQHEDVFQEWLLFLSRSRNSVLLEIATKARKGAGSPTSPKAVLVAEVRSEAAQKEPERLEKTHQLNRDIGRKDAIAKQGSVHKGWSIVSAIRAAVSSKQLSVNQDDSLIHIDVQQRTLLKSSEIFEWYAASNDIKSNTVKNQFCRLGLHNIKQSKKTYYKGTTASGIQIHGLLIEDFTALWGDLNPPKGNILIIE